MATYKVIQDVEAEDKLVGPLTLRQFIYAAITAVCLYVCFISVTKHVYFLLPVFLLPGALTGFFAFPWGRDQPTEIWALAKIRFMLKPRKRIWNQSGVQELVTITAPKRIEVNYTDGLSQTEVTSRLKALADTIDSRGWAVKNVTGGLYTQPTTVMDGGSDRLVTLDALPQEVPNVDVNASDDMLDEQTNPVASTFDRMITQSDQAHREQIIQTMQAQASSATPPAVGVAMPQLPPPTTLPFSQANPAPLQAAPSIAPTDDYWFMNQAPAMPSVHTQVVSPGSQPTASTGQRPETQEEKELAERLREQNNSQGISYAHLHKVLPLSEQQALAQRAAQAAAAVRAKQTPVTHQPDPAIIALASNNDLNVATIARQANRQNQEPTDEVVITLH